MWHDEEEEEVQNESRAGRGRGTRQAMFRTLGLILKAVTRSYSRFLIEGVA